MISGTWVAAHNAAAIWMMNLLTSSPVLISLMTTVASLPFFLFTLFAGVLADKVNRRKFVSAINIWLAAMAAALAALGWLHLLNPYLILASVFLLGVGFAFNAPGWTAIVSQIVSDSELPSAATLNGLQFNISGTIGPVLGGFLIPLAGTNFIFAINASCFLLVVLAIRRWKEPIVPKKLPSESFFKSFWAMIRYTRHVPRLRVIFARNFLFALFISVIPALMPAVGLKALHLGSAQLGLLFTSMGAGSVIGAVFVISWLRARFSPDSITLSGNLLIILAYVLLAFVRQAELFLAVAAVAGVGWTLSASELWVAAQRAMPSWARGRVNATVIMISQGAITLGSVMWGSAGAILGPSSTLFAAAVLFLTGLFLSRRLSINFAGNPQENASGVLSITEESRAPTSTALTTLFPS